MHDSLWILEIFNFYFVINITGQSSSSRGPYVKLRRSHGIVNMIGWGILMIIGAIIARHFKQKDPTWFYLHTSIQLIGFVLGIIGIVFGFILKNRLDANVNTHKGIGIFILALGCLQVRLLIISLLIIFRLLTLGIKNKKIYMLY